MGLQVRISANKYLPWTSCSHSHTFVIAHLLWSEHHLASVHQMALPLTCDNVRLIAAYYSSIDPKGWRLSWPSWLTYSGRFTHISDHPSAVGRAQDRESSPVKDQRFTAQPRNQLFWCPCRWEGTTKKLWWARLTVSFLLCILVSWKLELDSEFIWYYLLS